MNHQQPNATSTDPVCRYCGEEVQACDCDDFRTRALVSREEYMRLRILREECEEANWVEMPEFRKPARIERMQGEFNFDAEVA